MIRRFVLFAMLGFVSTSMAAAQVPDRLSDASFLRKLSLAIRGIPPTTDEYTEIASAKDQSARDQVIRKDIHLYLSSREHRDRMVFRLSERFAIKPPVVPTWFADNQVNNQILSYTFTKSPPDSMKELFNRVAEKNLSWDTLLTAKDYVAYPDAAFQFGISDVGFFRTVIDSLPFDGSGSIPQNYASLPRTDDKASYAAVFPADDLRVSGVLTTERFIGRNTTTGVNKNRRRAAAVFRIFLCDSMIPAISSSSDRKHDFLDVAYANHFEVTEKMVKENLTAGANARHGSDPQCFACHYKLDPMGRTFQNIGMVLSPDPSPGHLIYKKPSNGVLVDVPLRGIGDLGKAIAAQSEYVDCQVSWFWNEFIGQNVSLPQEKKQEWAKKFNSVGRKTNDFIEALVTSDEFRLKPVNLDIVTYDRVQPLLLRCDNCHSKEPDIPDFAKKLPIGFSGTKEEHIKWISKMQNRTGLPLGDKHRMPKNSSDWSNAELELVRTWLKQGAPDENGKPTVGGH